MTSHDPHASAAESVTSIGLVRIDHVGVAVPDLDEAIAFYERTFGMRCVHQEANEEQGVQQVAYTVTDVEATSAALRERGMRLLYETPRRGTAGSRINFVHPKDAGGVLVELVEPAR